MSTDNLLASQIGRIQSELKTFIDNSRVEIKDTIKAVGELSSRIDEQDRRHCATGGNERAIPAFGGKMIADTLLKSENMDLLTRGGRVQFEVKGALPMETKNTIVGTGLFAAQAATGVEAGGRYAYQLRQAIPSLPMDGGSVFVLKENVFTNNASPQGTEGSTKTESDITFTGATKAAVTLAHHVSASRQAVDDVPGLVRFLDQTLVWGLEQKIEQAILYGDGVTSLDGFDGNCTALDPTILSPSAGYDEATMLCAMQTQLRTAGYNPTTVVLHPNTWFRILTSRSSTGEYLISNPTVVLGMVLWGMRIILSPEQTEGTAFVFDASRVTMRERMSITVDVSNSHNENFTKNLLTFLAEWRGALVIPQAGAIISGTLTTSPA